MKEERKYKDVKTSELLDFINKDIPYEKTKEREKQSDYRNELEHRRPYYDFLRKINTMQEEINRQRKIIYALMHHQHAQDGEITVSIKKTDEARCFDRQW